MNKAVKDSKIQYIYKSTLLERSGWTTKAIELFLPNHHKEVRNPRYKKAAPSKLYDIAIVESIEASKEFSLFVNSSKKRVKGAQKAVETKRDRLMGYVVDLKIKVPTIEKKALIKKAVEHYNIVQYDWFHNKGGHRKQDQPYTATIDADEVFLKRIVLNYLRHDCTSYEKELFRIFGKVGKHEAYHVLKERINAAIVKKYSWLQ